MKRPHIVDIDQVKLEAKGYHIHATQGVEYVIAIKEISTHDIIWDHDPAFVAVLDDCKHPSPSEAE